MLFGDAERWGMLRQPRFMRTCQGKKPFAVTFSSSFSDIRFFIQRELRGIKCGPTPLGRLAKSTFH